MDESKLIARAARGDADAFGVLFEHYAGDVFRLAISMGYAGGEAEDLMQDTFMAAFEGIDRYEGRASFKTWLLAILFRQANRTRRYQKIRKTEVFEEGAPVGANGHARNGTGDEHARRMDVHVMLESLSPDHRAVLVLRELQGLTYEEIAEALDIPRGTVESRLHRARAILRKQFKEYERPRPASRPVVSGETLELHHE